MRQQCRDLEWSESQDLINVVWHTGESAKLHILVVHAQIILLTFGQLPPHHRLDYLDIITGDMRQRCPQFTNLLQMWFPPGGELPRAYLMDTGDEALLIQVNIVTVNIMS